MTEFVTLPSGTNTGAAERLDPFAVKRIADTGRKDCHVYGFGFETGVHIALPAPQVERIVTEGRTGGRDTRTTPAPERTFPHPVPGRRGW